jgi:hypothetical protein
MSGDALVIEVSGSSHPEANGTYLPKGEWGGKPMWSKVSPPRRSLG